MDWEIGQSLTSTPMTDEDVFVLILMFVVFVGMIVAFVYGVIYGVIRAVRGPQEPRTEAAPDKAERIEWRSDSMRPDMG